jgi:hypothetical protein
MTPMLGAAARLEYVGWSPTGRSALAREFASVDVRRRRQLGLSNALLAVTDGIVTACAVLVDDDDDRSWSERLEDLIGLLPPPDQLDRLRADLDRWVGNGTPLPSWLENIRSPSAQRFLSRFLGAAIYERITRAAKADGAIVAVAVRRGVRSLLPIASALDQCLDALSAQQMSQIVGLDAIGSSTLRLALQLDGVIDQAISLGLPIDEVSACESDREPLPDDLEALATQFGASISVESLSTVRALNEGLGRKIQGARDALDHSADPICQAATSMVELVDRLLRTSFTKNEVVEWVGSECPERWVELTHGDGLPVDERQPTKLAEALCFAYAGGEITDRSFFHEAAATALISARRELERLKHADVGSDDERKRLLDCIGTVEGFVVFVTRVGWIGVPDEVMERLRLRHKAVGA